MKKKVLILTLNDYIVYQPTILNLYDFLEPHFDITVISFLPRTNRSKTDSTRNIIYLATSPVTGFFYSAFDFVMASIVKRLRWIKPGLEFSRTYYFRYLPGLLRSAIRKRKLRAEAVIAVDLPALYEAQKLFGSVHLLSLEIENKSYPIHRKIDYGKIKSVIIQSEERYRYLFPGLSIPYFLIQNAPVFNESLVTHYPRRDFVWSGSLNPDLGIYECLDFFAAYPVFRLIIRGGDFRNTLKKIKEKYAGLIREDRIKIEEEYLPSAQFLDFLSHFRIGFCFYSWDIIRAKFNYASAPSGKLFMNLAAGVPVIACNIPGFRLVEEFGAGVLVDDYKPETIMKAAERIEKDYERYSEGCYAAARFFSFDKGVKPYIEYLMKETSGRESRL